MVTTSGGQAVVYTTSGGNEANGGGNQPGTCASAVGTTTCIPNWTNADSLYRGAWQEIR